LENIEPRFGAGKTIEVEEMHKRRLTFKNFLKKAFGILKLNRDMTYLAQ